MKEFSAAEWARMCKFARLPSSATAEELVAGVHRRLDRVERERAYDDPTGILKLDGERTIEYAPLKTDSREMSEDDRTESVLDAAVGRGAISMADRDTWRRRLNQEPDLGREIIESLPGNHARAEQAFRQDARLRALDNEFAAFLGIEREVEHDPDAGLPDAERAYRAHARQLGLDPAAQA